MKDKAIGIFSNSAPPGLCNKKEYASRKSAKASAKKQFCKRKLRAYKCRVCSYFHLTSADSEDREVIRLGKILDIIEGSK